jgi:hypothetical protein
MLTPFERTQWCALTAGAQFHACPICYVGHADFLREEQKDLEVLGVYKHAVLALYMDGCFKLKKLAASGRASQPPGRSTAERESGAIFLSDGFVDDETAKIDQQRKDLKRAKQLPQADCSDRNFRADANREKCVIRSEQGTSES